MGILLWDLMLAHNKLAFREQAVGIKDIVVHKQTIAKSSHHPVFSLKLQL